MGRGLGSRGFSRAEPGRRTSNYNRNPHTASLKVWGLQRAQKNENVCYLEDIPGSLFRTTSRWLKKAPESEALLPHI